MSCTGLFPSTSNRGTLVGILLQWDLRTGQGSNPFEIHSEDQVLIGRDKKTCHYLVADPFVSNTHLRIYTIIFDREHPEDVAPLVYAQDVSRNGTLWNDAHMARGSGGYLLSDGDVLTLSPNFHLKFCCAKKDAESTDEDRQLDEIKGFEDQYVVTRRKLGSGAYGKVYMAIDAHSGQQLACKVIDLRKIREWAARSAEQKSKFFTEDVPTSHTAGDEHCACRPQKIRIDEKLVRREVQKKQEAYDREARVLGRLCHPNIIGLERVIRTKNTIYLFEELVTAGDLFSFIEYKGGKLRDVEAAVVVRQILLALEYLHDCNIVHRDLKPDNILMTSLEDGCRVVLTDFGCAREVRPTVPRMKTVLGTAEYCAPEVAANLRGYTKAVDLWSLGCVTAVLLIGASPFIDLESGIYSEEIARSGDLSFLEAEMHRNKVGMRARDFVRRLLVLDETRRMDVKAALGHDWFTNPVHKREFERLYLRAIKNWTPRVWKDVFVISLDSQARVTENCKKRGLIGRVCRPFAAFESEDGASRHSSGSKDQELSGSLASESSSSSCPQDGHMYCSQTLSDPELPPLRKQARRVAADDANKFPLIKHKATANTPQNGTIDGKKHWRKAYPVGNSFRPAAQASAVASNAGIETLPFRPAFEPFERNLPGSSTTPFGSVEITGGCPIDERWTDDNDDGEVYEEIDNAVTGQRHQIPYRMISAAKVGSELLEPSFTNYIDECTMWDT